MTTQVLPRTVVNADEIYSSDMTAVRPLGEKIQLVDEETRQTATYIYVKASSSINAHTPCVLTTCGDCIAVSSPVTNIVPKRIGVPQVGFAQGAYGYVCIEGPCKAFVGTTASSCSQVQAVNGGKKFVDAGSQETVNSQAVCSKKIETGEAGSDGLLTTVVLIGKAVPITASI